MTKKVLSISPEESSDYRGLPRIAILKMYIKAHKDERCPHCHRLIGNHTTKQLSKCVDKDILVSKLPEV